MSLSWILQQVYFIGLLECVCIGVLRHMQQYFSYIFDSTDVQAD